MTPKVQTRDFGANCPTPLVVSPPVERGVRKVTMVSESIQTECETKTSQRSSKTNERKHLKGRDHSPGMFTPEQSDSDASINLKQRRPQKRPVKAAQGKAIVNKTQKLTIKKWKSHHRGAPFKN